IRQDFGFEIVIAVILNKGQQVGDVDFGGFLLTLIIERQRKIYACWESYILRIPQIGVRLGISLFIMAYFRAWVLLTQDAGRKQHISQIGFKLSPCLFEGFDK